MSKDNTKKNSQDYFYVTDDLDLHGFFPEQVPDIVNEFIWNANQDLWRSLTVNAIPLNGETDFSDNQNSINVRVWKVCDVIDCNEFYPRTTKDNYLLNEEFNSSVLIVNRWNDQQFYDLRLELDSTNGISIISPKLMYIDIAPGQTTVKRWLVEGIDYGIEELSLYAGNREYSDSKQIIIN